MVPVNLYELRQKFSQLAGATPPGRLGDTSMTLLTDPRTLPAIAHMAETAYFGRRASTAPWPEDIEEVHKIIESLDQEFNKVCRLVPLWVPGDDEEPDVEEEQVTIEGLDGNEILLYIVRPRSHMNTLPGIMYIHGGVLIMIDTMVRPHQRWTKSLALKGHVVIVPDFRNAWTKSGYNPFPAALNDCVAAVDWIDTNRAALGINKIVLQGESGGGNLAMATAIRANREGWAKIIAGVSVYCPYIGGEAHSWPAERKLKELPSLIENQGYILERPWIGPAAYYYSPSDITNPLAWPYFAEKTDLIGLPPHSIVLDELDPLRDEGIAYYRKLNASGVAVSAEVYMGVPHACAVLFRQAIPDVYEKLCSNVSSFANEV